MAIYRVLIPVGAADPAAMAERADFIREGFSWPALLFGPLWLLAHGLWRALGVWCLGALIVAAAMFYGRAPDFAANWLYFLSAVWLGLEGQDLVADARRRAGFRFVDIVTGADSTAAEHGFFSRWLADSAPASPVARPNARGAQAHLAQAHVIGLFPEAGG
jgi:hypothetical protein